MLNLTYPNLLTLFQEHLHPKRTESASFLIWYLENYYRLDALEAVDSICDQKGDKGVDGIYVNEAANSIDVFQSRIFQDDKHTLGDTALKEFRGTLTQFGSQASLQNLVDTAGTTEVAKLITRLDLITKLPGYEIRGIFLTNVERDANAKAYLAHEPMLTVVDRTELNTNYISDERNVVTSTDVTFDVSGFAVSKYIVDSKTRMLVVPLKARELVTLQGIGDQSVFAFNVRGPLGRTQVNKDIVQSIKDAKKHKLFPLFHNGITIISEKVHDDSDKITIKNYHVVNGCQSLSALFENKSNLSDELRVLVKLLEMDVDSSLSNTVTQYSNNQNGVKPRDFKSNSPIQIRLQNEFQQKYPNKYAFEIKRGEHPGPGEIISNEESGLYLMAFDLKEPWATHRKYTLFDEKHADIFARPEVNADRILMCHILMKTIISLIPNIENGLFGKYVLTRFVILYILRLILEKDKIGIELIKNPSAFVRNPSDRLKLTKAIKQMVQDMVVDINAEVKPYGDDFDYRGKLRDSTWVNELSKTVVGTYEKMVMRGRVPSFEQTWNSIT